MVVPTSVSNINPRANSFFVFSYMFFISQIMFSNKYSQPVRKYRSEQSSEIKIIVMLITVPKRTQPGRGTIYLGFPMD
jgi:hypothetical protein